MLSKAIKKEIQEAYRAFLKSRKLKARFGQRHMIAFIANALGSVEWDEENKRASPPSVSLVEAGTGTGKTLGYALAAIPITMALEKTLVISTATIALQEQIIFRDLPDIQQHSGLEFGFSLAKGRHRYACLNKLDQILQNAAGINLSMNFSSETSENPTDVVPGELYETLLEAFNRGQWNGEREHWKEAIDDKSWHTITTTHHQCANRKCGYFRQCPFFKARAAIDRSDVVVTNHDMILSDLRLGGGAILPAPEQCVYVFDEGHHLPLKTLEHFSCAMALVSGRQWLEQTSRQIKGLLAQNPLPDPAGMWLEKLQTACDTMAPVLGQMGTLCRESTGSVHNDTTGQQARTHTYRFPDGVVPEKMITLAKRLESQYSQCLNLADDVLEVLKKAMDGNIIGIDSEFADRLLPQIAAMAHRFMNGKKLMASYAEKDTDSVAPLARWIEWNTEHHNPEELFIKSSMIEAGKTLYDALWSRAGAAVITSATLTALGSFGYFERCAGIPEGASAIRLPSPFDYKNAATLTIPQMSKEPGHVTGHTEELIQLLPGLLDQFNATLVLFSSRKQMWDVFKGLEHTVTSSILMQDQYTKSELIKTHRERIGEDKKSTIFGLASLAEGIDLPGKLCEHVIIAKIPFSVPDDPVEASRAEWLVKQGGNPFMEITVPEASMRLIQATGRLLRHENDRGNITLLDKRLLTKRYGKALLDALPPYARQYNHTITSHSPPTIISSTSNEPV